MTLAMAELNVTFQNSWTRDPTAWRGTQKGHRAGGGEGRRHRRMLPLEERVECFTVLQALTALPRSCKASGGRRDVRWSPEESCSEAET